MGIVIFTAGLPLSPPTSVLVYTVGWSHYRSWASTSSPTGLPLPPPTGVSAYTAGLLCRCWWASSLSPSTAFVAADWCLHCY
uniref:HGWP repeat containing protein-like n=1 Tax=Oryza sativa subsp. japonica TaxID=39947 RepID=Q6ZFG5_ORYSJ|nr:HGWP repeat containing protein-like [Oryza sativa Japonica Group]BAD05273.1 HGWP repeat containing protein-like [Oryza sativa Japonica Group]